MITVVCWLWSDADFRFRSTFRYTPEHVERLRCMVSANLSAPHRFVCLTDRPQEAFTPDVEVIPIWDDLAHLGGCYRRLRAFSEEMQHVLGERFVSMDVDCVITGSLDSLLDRDEDFVIWEDVDPRQPICGSMWMMNAGARSHVWDMFDYAAATELKRKHGHIGTDQAWMASVLSHDEYSMWTKKDGVYSASDRRFRLGRFMKAAGPMYHKRMVENGRTTKLPDDCRIVFFHGKRDPSMKMIQQVHPWIEEHYGPPFETTAEETT